MSDQTHRDYSRRSVVDKLGVKAGHMVAVAPLAGPLDAALEALVAERAGAVETDPAIPVDVVLMTAETGSEVVTALRAWRDRIAPNGGIWVLTPKRGRPGYLRGEDLIPMGLEAGLVDNKICSVSDTVSGMRFVLRLRDRL
jgi:hypothetical protein